MPLIAVGTQAPAFALPDQEGTTRALRDDLGRPVVLYFYPKDDTSGCTKEACRFRDARPALAKLGAVVLGVSPDDAASHAKFAAKHELGFPLLADAPAANAADRVPKTCAKYGVWQEKSMYGRTYMGVVRTTYLIDAAGIVARRWDKVKVPGHADAVLESVRALTRSV